MRNMFRRRVVSAAVMGITMLGMLVSPAAAEVIVASSNDCGMPSVNAAGNPGRVIGGQPCKRYKYTRLKLLVLVARGVVPNLSGRPAVFRNLGCGIRDPQTGRIEVADSDLTVVAMPFRTTEALAVLVCTKKLP